MRRIIRWIIRLCLPRHARLEFDLMSASQDLATNVAALQSAVTAYENAVAAKLAEPAGDDPNVVAANAALVSVTQQLDAATAALAPAQPAA